MHSQRQATTVLEQESTACILFRHSSLQPELELNDVLFLL